MKKLIEIMGRRGLGLLTFGLLDICWAVRLATVDPNKTEFYRWLHNACPLWVVAIGWLGVGIICLMQIFAEDKTLAFKAATFLKVVWALMYFFGWLTGILIDGWASAATWIGFAISVAIIAGVNEAPPGKVGPWIQR